MKLSFYGADQCVTGSCHCLEVNGKNILIDNSFQAKLAEARENFQFDSAAQTGGTIHG